MNHVTMLGEDEVPLPPIELMRTVGPVDPDFYRNPHRVDVFGHERPGIDYSGVFDFGCGCGRLARQMMFQRSPPETYVGVDLNPHSIAWCRANLAPARPGLRFDHLDIFNRGLNPAGSRQPLPFPAADGGASLVIAHSVFTHILQPEVAHYMSECARVMRRPGGLFRSTWFLFDKALFPMLQDFQNALYINLDDPTNAVVYDLGFVRGLFDSVGLTIVQAIPPEVRGFQWILYAVPAGEGPAAAFPDDDAPLGRMAPPS